MSIRCTNVCNFFFDSKNFFISFLSVKQIFMSVFVEKLVLPISQKYLSGILYTYLLSICVPNFAILSSILSSVVCVVSLLLCIQLPEFAGYTTAFLLYKISFWVIFSVSVSRSFSIDLIQRIFRFLGVLLLVWGFICTILSYIYFLQSMCKVIQWYQTNS